MSAILNQLIHPNTSWGEDPAWNSKNLATLIEGGVGGDQRTTFFWRLRYQDAKREAGYNMVTSREVARFWPHAKRIGADQGSLARFNNAASESIIAWRIDLIQPTRQHCQCAPSHIER